MSINSIGQLGSYGGGGFGGGGISEETRRKLIALGIDPRTVTSEAQAQALIQNAIKIRKSSNTPLPINVCQGEQELISKAKRLASKMGIIVSNTMPVEEILKLISDKINHGNFEEFKPEYQALEEACKTIKQHENNMYASMNYNASLNKMMLGL